VPIRLGFCVGTAAPATSLRYTPPPSPSETSADGLYLPTAGGCASEAVLSSEAEPASSLSLEDPCRHPHARPYHISLTYLCHLT
jgi:hypothetical protein